MAFPTAINDQITDSVTQSAVTNFGSAPALALATLFQATSQALSLAAANATTQQQQLNILAQAALTRGIESLGSSAAVPAVGA